MTGHYEITIHEFDNFDPMYSILKRGLTPGDEKNWEYVTEDVRYLMEYSGGARCKGNSSWSSRNGLEIHYELTGGINYSVIKKPKTPEELEKAKLRAEKKKPAEFNSPAKMPKLREVQPGAKYEMMQNVLDGM